MNGPGFSLRRSMSRHREVMISSWCDTSSFSADSDGAIEI
jgi:hypothetical protein